MLPAEVRTVILKPEKERTAAEQKIADDYYPVLRIDPDKIEEVMPPDDLKKYKELRSKLNQADRRRTRAAVPELPAFWTVEVDHALRTEKSYILTSGDPERPEKDKPVEPGWPFAPEKIDFRDGRVEAFSDWLTAPENPLFARVAVNRLWQWHFGEGLQRRPATSASGRQAANPALLDWLASEFVARGYSMKAMHRLMVTSRDVQAGVVCRSGNRRSADSKVDPQNTYLWSFRLQRLEAEPCGTRS